MHTSGDVVVGRCVLIGRGAIELFVCFIRVNVFKGYVAGFAEVGRVFVYVRFFFDVGRRRCSVGFWFVGVHESCVSDNIPAVSRCVRARAAAMDALARSGGRRGTLATFLFKHAGYVALFLELSNETVSNSLT